jgi:hypothetical protein
VDVRLDTSGAQPPAPAPADSPLQAAEAARLALRASLEASDAPNLLISLPPDLLGADAPPVLRVELRYSAGDADRSCRSPLLRGCATFSDFAFLWVRPSASGAQPLSRLSLLP